MLSVAAPLCATAVPIPCQNRPAQAGRDDLHETAVGLLNLTVALGSLEQCPWCYAIAPTGRQDCGFALGAEMDDGAQDAAAGTGRIFQRRTEQGFLGGRGVPLSLLCEPVLP